MTRLYGCRASLLSACSARATSPLPVPLSPVSRTVLGEPATFSIKSKTACTCRTLPMI